jgi:hypothetical protein
MIWDMRYEIKNEMPFLHTYPPVKMEQTECSETLAYKIQAPENYPEESIQDVVHLWNDENPPSLQCDLRFLWG